MFSRTLKTAEWVNTTIASGQLDEKIDELRRGGDGHIVAWRGVTLPQIKACRRRAHHVSVCAALATVCTSERALGGNRLRGSGAARVGSAGAVGGAVAGGVLVEALGQVQAFEHELDGGGHRSG